MPVVNIKRKKESSRYKRHIRLRKKIIGDNQKPRLFVYRSLKNMQVQLINDIEQVTIISASTTSKEFKKGMGKASKIKAAEKLGEYLSQKAIEKGIEQVRFDRGGCLYHGRIKAFAESARKGGLKF